MVVVRRSRQEESKTVTIYIETGSEKYLPVSMQMNRKLNFSSGLYVNEPRPRHRPPISEDSICCYFRVVLKNKNKNNVGFHRDCSMPVKPVGISITKQSEGTITRCTPSALYY